MSEDIPGGEPLDVDRVEHLADEVHQAFLNARVHLRDGYPVEDAADREGLRVDAFVDALDGSPEDIRGTNTTACDGCGEPVTPYVSAGGGSASGRQGNGVPAGVSWCAWDDAGIPPGARPEGWRESRPSDGFPCPQCGEELDVDAISVQNSGAPEFANRARCRHCWAVLGGDDGE